MYVKIRMDFVIIIMKILRINVAFTQLPFCTNKDAILFSFTIQA